MSKLVKLSIVAAAALLACGSAQAAGANRVWVSGHGTDQTGCGAPTAPCRSLQYAHDNIGAGGEIDILDPAGYGAVSITKAISIVNDGVGTAGVQAASGSAVTINAGPTDSVYLRGLNIDGVRQQGLNGILFQGGGALTIVDCVARHFENAGIALAPASGSMRIGIANTIASDNHTAGVVLSPSSGTVGLVLDHVTTGNDNTGIAVSAQEGTLLNVTLWYVVASNDGTGVQATSSVAPVYLNIDNSVMNDNVGDGLNFDHSIIVSLSRSALDENGNHGVSNAASDGGIFKSTGDNRILDNNMADINGPGPSLEALH